MAGVRAPCPGGTGLLAVIEVERCDGVLKLLTNGAAVA
jgi:hypothetical protein